MAAVRSLKASEKQAICKKIVTVLKKRYKGSAPKPNLDVLNTLIFCICLEENSYENAVKQYEHLLASFHDLNEIRVSSITELEAVFRQSPHPEWRALRIRSLLFYVFELNFQYEYEAIRRKTQEQAVRLLKKIKDISPFMVLQALQYVLGSHVMALDARMLNLAIWLGLVEPGSNPDAASDQIKSAVRKSDVPLFNHLLREMSANEAVSELVAEEVANPPSEGFDLTAAPARIDDLYARSKLPRKKKSASSRAKSKSAAAKKPAAKKTASKKTPKKKTTKGSAASRNAQTAKKKAAAKKPAAKKKAAKKTVKKKAATKSGSKKPTKKKAAKKKARKSK